MNTLVCSVIALLGVFLSAEGSFRGRRWEKRAGLFIIAAAMAFYLVTIGAVTAYNREPHLLSHGDCFDTIWYQGTTHAIPTC